MRVMRMSNNAEMTARGSHIASIYDMLSAPSYASSDASSESKSADPEVNPRSPVDPGKRTP